MREIKFRAFDLSLKRMRTVLAINFEDETVYVRDGKGVGTWLFFSEVVLVQFTGLHDKNGKKIYEDDVVKSGNGRIWTVRSGQFKFTIPIKQKIEASGFYICPIEKEYQESGNIPLNEGLEVIGNIYEHPELLDNHPHHD